MSKNYKLWVYTEVPCPPCDDMGTYPSASAASRGYEFEEVILERKSDTIGWVNTPIDDFVGTPWFKLENLDDNSTVDNFCGGNKARFDILIDK